LKTTEYRLLDKIKIGPVELPNRIVFGSHPTNFAAGNLLSDQHAAYYRERAKGGAGMIVLEELLVHPSDLPYEKALFGYVKEIIPGCRRVAGEVHRHGAVAVAQLNHSGLQSDGSAAMRELWAPSAVPDVMAREVPKSMEESDIREVVAGFAAAAGHAVEGGLDGVEINAAQFSLIRQFMSPLTNHRTDAYGGELTNRLRFCVEVLQSVRAVIGVDKLLGLRLCGDEFAPWGGLTPDDAVEIACILEQLNVLDYITVAVGSLYSPHLSTATHYSEPGLALAAAAAVKKAAGLPVFAEGRIHCPEFAARIVDEGLVDGVCMNRALIADPDLPRKIASGEIGRVMECLSCNQGCQVRHSMGRPLSCLLNPRAGVESNKEMMRIKPAIAPKKVLVVGAGPAGLEAARVAAARGHHVTVWEAEPAPGGAMAASAYIGEVARVISAWQEELAACGARLVTGKQCLPEDILAWAPDALVLATGAKTDKPAFPVKDCAVMSAWEAATGFNQAGENVLFWDETGDQLMGRVVEKLLAAGKKVYLVTPDLFMGSKMAVTMELSSWNQRFMSALSGIFTSCQVKEINSGRAVIANRFSGRETALEGIDTLVYNCWPQPEDSLYLALRGRVKEIYRAGDCLAPRGIGAAVREGYQVGKRI
jgi:mycofactocin system FadH/OYE family oxidoreductase 2